MAVTSNSESVVKRNHTLRAATPIATTLSKFWRSPGFAFVPIAGVALIFLVPGFSILISLLVANSGERSHDPSISQ